VELFTESEKQYIKTEFTYNRSKRNNRNFENSGVFMQKPDEFQMSDLDKDMFTEHLLDSAQNSMLKNCETKSVILAPFNSTKSNLETVALSDSVKDMIEDRKIIKFGARVRDIDR